MNFWISFFVLVLGGLIFAGGIFMTGNKDFYLTAKNFFGWLIFSKYIIGVLMIVVGVIVIRFAIFSY